MKETFKTENQTEQIAACRQEIIEILNHSRLPQSLGHAQRTEHWLEQLLPTADELLKIAALGHDLDTCREPWRILRLADEAEQAFKKRHAEKSAELISTILHRYNFPETDINKVKQMVADHENGETELGKILMWAESLAFLEYNVPFYLKQKGSDKTKSKVQEMFNRLPPHLQEIAKPLLKQI
jgi:chemotaxis protein histidine kinase CheA